LSVDREPISIQKKETSPTWPKPTLTSSIFSLFKFFQRDFILMRCPSAPILDCIVTMPSPQITRATARFMNQRCLSKVLHPSFSPGLALYDFSF
jgi:hypothetical protein